jgi:uncharacterized YccA/Bax inhibitor family protein
MRSSNPVIKEKIFAAQARAHPGSVVMTVDGTMAKTAILLTILTICATFTFRSTVAAQGLNPTFIWGGLIAGFVLGLVISFKPGMAPMLAPAYAACQGLFLGGVSGIYHLQYQGIVLQAVLLTLGIALAMLAIYRFKIIRVTERFKAVVMAGMMGIFFVYMLSFVMSLFGASIPFLHSTGPIGIGISVVFIVVVSMMLLLDFDMIEKGAQTGKKRPPTNEAGCARAKGSDGHGRARQNAALFRAQRHLSRNVNLSS